MALSVIQEYIAIARAIYSSITRKQSHISDIDIDSRSSWMTEQYKNNIDQSSGYCAKDIKYTVLL